MGSQDRLKICCEKSRAGSSPASGIIDLIEIEPKVLTWIDNIPELETRPVLLQAVIDRNDVRKRLFNSVAAMESIAFIPSVHVAERCLLLWWREERRILYKYWCDKLRNQTGSDRLFNELFGCLRNVWDNMFLKVGSKRKVHKRSAYDVVRSYR